MRSVSAVISQLMLDIKDIIYLGELGQSQRNDSSFTSDW